MKNDCAEGMVNLSENTEICKFLVHEDFFRTQRYTEVTQRDTEL